MSGRVKFLDPAGNPGAPLQGQAIVYFTNDSDGLEFLDAFGLSCFSPDGEWVERGRYGEVLFRNA